MSTKKNIIFLPPQTSTFIQLKDIFKIDDDKIFYEYETLEEAIILGLNIKPALWLATDLRQAVSFLSKKHKILKKSGSKLALFQSKQIPKNLASKLAQLGLNNIIYEPVPLKSLHYKINLLIKALPEKKALEDDPMKKISISGIIEEKKEDDIKMSLFQDEGNIKSEDEKVIDSSIDGLNQGDQSEEGAAKSLFTNDETDDQLKKKESFTLFDLDKKDLLLNQNNEIEDQEDKNNNSFDDLLVEKKKKELLGDLDLLDSDKGPKDSLLNDGDNQGDNDLSKMIPIIKQEKDRKKREANNSNKKSENEDKELDLSHNNDKKKRPEFDIETLDYSKNKNEYEEDDSPEDDPKKRKLFIETDDDEGKDNNLETEKVEEEENKDDLTLESYAEEKEKKKIDQSNEIEEKEKDELLLEGQNQETKKKKHKEIDEEEKKDEIELEIEENQTQKKKVKLLIEEEEEKKRKETEELDYHKEKVDLDLIDDENEDDSQDGANENPEEGDNEDRELKGNEKKIDKKDDLELNQEKKSEEESTLNPKKKEKERNEDENENSLKEHDQDYDKDNKNNKTRTKDNKNPIHTIDDWTNTKKKKPTDDDFSIDKRQSGNLDYTKKDRPPNSIIYDEKKKLNAGDIKYEKSKKKGWGDGSENEFGGESDITENKGEKKTEGDLEFSDSQSTSENSKETRTFYPSDLRSYDKIIKISESYGDEKVNHQKITFNEINEIIKTKYSGLSNFLLLDFKNNELLDTFQGIEPLQWQEIKNKEMANWISTRIPQWKDPHFREENQTFLFPIYDGPQFLGLIFSQFDKKLSLEDSEVIEVVLESGRAIFLEHRNASLEKEEKKNQNFQGPGIVKKIIKFTVSFFKMIKSWKK